MVGGRAGRCVAGFGYISLMIKAYILHITKSKRHCKIIFPITKYPSFCLLLSTFPITKYLRFASLTPLVIFCSHVQSVLHSSKFRSIPPLQPIITHQCVPSSFSTLYLIPSNSHAPSPSTPNPPPHHNRSYPITLSPSPSRLT